MTEVQRYDTVVLVEPINGVQQGDKGAVVEVYTFPYEAYDIEIITDDGITKGLVEAVRREQFKLLAETVESKIRFKTILLKNDGATAAVRFSDGTEVTVRADELYAAKQ